MWIYDEEKNLQTQSVIVNNYFYYLRYYLSLLRLNALDFSCHVGVDDEFLTTQEFVPTLSYLSSHLHGE